MVGLVKKSNLSLSLLQFGTGIPHNVITSAIVLHPSMPMLWEVHSCPFWCQSWMQSQAPMQPPATFCCHHQHPCCSWMLWQMDSGTPWQNKVLEAVLDEVLDKRVTSGVWGVMKLMMEHQSMLTKHHIIGGQIFLNVQGQLPKLHGFKASILLWKLPIHKQNLLISKMTRNSKNV